MEERYDVVVVGAGPAGLSAALNLARARRRVLVLDSNRPRNAATMVSHGFITRDGVPPHELRRLAREELAGYPEAELQLATVTSVFSSEVPISASHLGDGLAETGTSRVSAGGETGAAGGGAGSGPGTGFEVRAKGVNGSPSRAVTAASVLVATGLKETLPALPSIRAFYGLGLFSCIECDGYEHSDRPLALIGETSDLASRALLIAQWSHNLVVFTNGVATIPEGQEQLLAERGVRIERRPIDDIVGERGVVSAVRLAGGDEVRVEGGFVRPLWEAALDYAAELGLATDGWGLLETDADGRTSVPGVYAAGDSTAPGPQQLIVAAGAGARVAAAINRDLIGIPRR